LPGLDELLGGCRIGPEKAYSPSTADDSA